jgi:Uncharacterised nucleotidyltransferase
MSVNAPARATDCRTHLDALCSLTLNPGASLEAVAHVARLRGQERERFLALADSHHVVIRGLVTVEQTSERGEVKAWAGNAIAAERQRIANALARLNEVCTALEQAGCATTVMKSLDHWPDLGNDLDLFTTADEQRVAAVMTEKFGAHIEPRSWGDRLANKWNFALPRLKEAIEVHCKRLGQTGEHIAMARRFITRRVPKQLSGYTFMVPAPEERVIVATLQRMYRHFYFRVCDIVDNAALIESSALDYRELRIAALQGGIWPGVATFLCIVADYAQRYRGRALPLPDDVRSAARFGGEQVTPGGKFLRVPIMPHGAKLYTEQVTQTALRGDVPATFRLTLLPPLASAAAVAYRLTGSDKGVW